MWGPHEYGWAMHGIAPTLRIGDAMGLTIRMTKFLSSRTLLLSLAVPTILLSLAPGATAIDNQRQGELDYQVQHMTDEIKNDPKNPEYYFTRGSVYRARGNLDLAIADYNAAIARGLKKWRDQCYEGRGTCFLKMNRPVAALDDFNRALTFNPDLFEARKNRAAALLRVGHAQQAIDELNLLMPKHKDSTLLLSRARAEAVLKQFDKASADIDAAKALNSSDPWVPLERARLYLTMKQPQKAMDELIVHQSSLGSAGEYWSLLAEGYYAFGNYKQTVLSGNQAMSLRFSSDDLYSELADSYSKLGEHKHCVGLCNAALQLNPNNGLAYLVRGRTWRHLKQMDKAKPDLDKAASLGFSDK